jgi:predicted AAA+ superfamily ATPase
MEGKKMETMQENMEISGYSMLRAMLQDITERQRETERQIRESAERLGKQLGNLNNCFDEMVENIVMPDLMRHFGEIGLVFDEAYPHTVINDGKNNIKTKVDITLENGDKVMIIEVKAKPSTKDIEDHVKRMEMLRQHADLHGDKRRYLGTMAGMTFDNDEKQCALKNGFYVVEPYGDAFVITVPEGDCFPKEW